jgi:hypothetical protein
VTDQTPQISRTCSDFTLIAKEVLPRTPKRKTPEEDGGEKEEEKDANFSFLFLDNCQI